MQKTIKKIAFLTFLILVLPISAFFIYQFASLNESEKEINKIYIQQLEAVLFSINQYSEDVVSSWMNDINIILTSDKFDYNIYFQKFLTDNNSIKSVLISDSNFTEWLTFSSLSSAEERTLQDSVKQILKDNRPLLDKLQNYLKKGYQKIEPLGKFSNDSLYLCLFPMRTEDNEKKIASIILNPHDFIQHNLVSKISQATANEFVVTIISDKDNRNIYSSETIFENSEVSKREIILEKPLWLLPGLSLGIKMKTGTIDELVSHRFYENLIVLGLLSFILIIGVILIFYNLRKELRLTQLKSDFVTNVSHELRTPLALISVYSETLVLDRIKTEEKKHEYYSVIHNETNRLSKIVNSILNFSKMENGTRKFDFQNCNLVDISNEVFQTYDYHIKSKGYNYTLNYLNHSYNIIADRDAVSESMINLIENAIKYGDKKKELIITINTNNKGPYWEIQDFGMGINKEDQLKIFDKFYRVSSGLVHDTKGTGLGLSLVKQIMEAHNGEISVESSPGSGSKFKLQFYLSKKN